MRPLIFNKIGYINFSYSVDIQIYTYLNRYLDKLINTSIIYIIAI